MPRVARLFFGNFDFEHRLPAAQRGRKWSLTAAAKRLNAELACAWAGIASDGDAIRLPAAIEPGLLDLLAEQGLPRVRPVFDSDRARDVREFGEIVPWGWTDDVRRWADRRGLPYRAPPQEAVARANARSFSAAIETELGTALPGAATIRSLDDLARALRGLRSHRGRWVVKAEFGMSARERMIGMGESPDRRTADWIRARIARDGVVHFEPWVERVAEAGVQFAIPETGPPTFEGIAPLLADVWGRYRGSRFEVDLTFESERRGAIEAGREVARRAAALGYFGPLGIDACRWRDLDGEIHLRPVQDVNARWTMGALARGFRRLLAPGEAGTWLHFAWPTDAPDGPRRAFEKFRAQLPPGVRAIRTSPFEVEGRPNAHGTAAVIAPRGTPGAAP
jgi:hypothetical protein